MRIKAGMLLCLLKEHIVAAISVCALIIATGAAQVPAPKAASAKPGGPKSTVAATAGASKFKAIWEPAPFNKDVDLNAIACVGPETCWVGGAKSTILFTTDGGRTWRVQLGGDPES